MKTLIHVCVVSAIGAGLSFAAQAETWEGVYTYPAPNNSVIYADTDSASRKGDIATIYEKTGSGPRMLRTFDCVRAKVLDSWPENKVAELNEVTGPSFEKACKRTWEFWK